MLTIDSHPSAYCFMGSAPVGVQCRPFSTCLDPAPSVEYVNFLSTPLLNVVQPLAARSSSPRQSIHCSRNHLLHQPVVLHPEYMYVSKQALLSFHDVLYHVLLALLSSSHFFIRNLSLQSYPQDSSM